MKNLKISISLTLSALLGACGGTSTGNVGQIASLDITDAVSLMISGASSSLNQQSFSISNSYLLNDLKPQAESTTSKLLKIDANGNITQVTAYNSKGQSIEYTQAPAAIHDAGEWLFIGFGSDSSNIFDGYIVNKTSGAAYSTGTATDPHTFPKPQYNSYKNGNFVQLDTTGNMYFKHWSGSGASGGTLYSVFKISANDTSATSTIVTPSIDSVDSFTVDKAGNIAYDGYSSNSLSTQVARIKKADGSTQNRTTALALPWVATNGNIRYLSSSNIYEVNLSSSGAEDSVVVSGGSFTTGFHAGQSFKLEVASKVFLVNQSTAAINEVQSAPGSFSLSGVTMSSILDAEVSSDTLYLAGTLSNGNSAIVSINPTNGAATNLLPGNLYDVYEFSVSSDNKINFNALRFSDSKRVVGQIVSGVVTILDETSDYQTTVLKRIR